MRAVVQRVSHASVSVNGECTGSIKKGLLILLGVEEADDEDDVAWLAQKITRMRIFEDEEGKMNKCLLDCNGELLVVSQFTLHASTKKGNRPSFMHAAKPEKAEELYEAFIRQAEEHMQISVAAGVFGADMKVELLNDGPVTIIIDSKTRW